MKILYSYNKSNFEEKYWNKELKLANCKDFEIIPFNHGNYFDISKILRAQLLDNLFYQHDKGLLTLYKSLKEIISQKNIDVLVVDNCFPYHPEFLASLNVFKVIRTTDGPVAAFDRDFAYVHSYDLVLYHSPAFSEYLTYPQKLNQLGISSHEFWPFASFRSMRDPNLTVDNLFQHERDIDVIFVGALHFDKMPLLAHLKKRLGKKFRFNGLSSIKRNIYFNVKYGFPGWVHPIAGDEHSKLYRRAKVGINIHNRGKFTVGSYRLFDLPANGVLQISDGGEYLDSFFKTGSEILNYDSVDELVDLIDFYLNNQTLRNEIALEGFKKAIAIYDIKVSLTKMYELIIKHMKNNSSFQNRIVV
jgi:spore maturation protein CgeB